MRMFVRGAALLTAVLWTGAAAGAVRIEASSATVGAAGETAAVCVRLQSGGQEVAGTENRLEWDGSCAALAPGRASCRVARGIDKDLAWDFPPNTDFTLKALVISFTDVDPIPDGELYCCTFTAEAAAGACCPIAVVAPGASDSKGNAIVPVEGNTAELCVDTAPRPGADDDGCQVAAPRSGAWLLLAGAALLWRARRRRVYQPST